MLAHEISSVPAAGGEPLGESCLDSQGGSRAGWTRAGAVEQPNAEHGPRNDGKGSLLVRALRWATHPDRRPSLVRILGWQADSPRGDGQEQAGGLHFGERELPQRRMDPQQSGSIYPQVCSTGTGFPSDSGSLDVGPRLSVNDCRSGSHGDVKLRADCPIGTKRLHGPDFQNLCIGEFPKIFPAPEILFLGIGKFARWSVGAALRVRVPVVVPEGAEPKIIWINVAQFWRYIVTMKNPIAVWYYAVSSLLSFSYCPRHPVGKEHLPFYANHSIAIPRFKSGPLPYAILSFYDVAEKTVLDFFVKNGNLSRSVAHNYLMLYVSAVSVLNTSLRHEQFQFTLAGAQA